MATFTIAGVPRVAGPTRSRRVTLIYRTRCSAVCLFLISVINELIQKDLGQYQMRGINK